MPKPDAAEHAASNEILPADTGEESPAQAAAPTDPAAESSAADGARPARAEAGASSEPEPAEATGAREEDEDTAADDVETSVETVAEEPAASQAPDSPTDAAPAGASEEGESDPATAAPAGDTAAPLADAAPAAAAGVEAGAGGATQSSGGDDEGSPAQPSPEDEGSLAPPSPELEAILLAHQRGERVEGRVIGWNKGGFHVVVDGVPAFCPKSQIEIDNPKRAAAYVDRTFPFRVLEIKDNGKRVVLTRRQVLVEDRAAGLDRLRKKRASGEPVDGKVTSITDFGAFVDVGGIEGLVHLSQLSRRRVETARELVQVGQDVRVRVLKIEKGGDRISLSMKALEPDPWNTISERFATGSTFEGTIARKADFGLFVDVGDGIEGLVHTSNLELGKSLESAEYEPGQTIAGWVREVDPERRRLSLALREVAHANPWSDVRSRYSEGTEVEGQVEQVARFGVFVELEPGLTGLLPFSSLPESHGPRPQRQFQPGEKLQVVVDAIDVKRKRISLAPIGSKLEGTKSDYRDYQKKHTSSGGLGALAAAFEKIQQS